MSPTLTLWLLLTLPADPAKTEALGLHPTREACEAVQVAEFVANRATRCQAIEIPVADWKGPRQ